MFANHWCLISSVVALSCPRRNFLIEMLFILLYCAEFPFEFRALEVALEAICSFLDARTRELETAAYPALDELTSKASLSLKPVCLLILCVN